MMEGVDLITEGTMTLARVAEMLERGASEPWPDNPARDLMTLMLQSDIVEFVVGTRINEAHQDPNVPVELDLRRNIIRRIVASAGNQIPQGMLGPVSVRNGAAVVRLPMATSPGTSRSTSWQITGFAVTKQPPSRKSRWAGGSICGRPMAADEEHASAHNHMTQISFWAPRRFMAAARAKPALGWPRSLPQPGNQP